MNLLQLIKQDPRVLPVLYMIGTYYSYGAGDMSTVAKINLEDPETLPKGYDQHSKSFKGRGIDCSGLQQWVWQVLEMVAKDAWHDKTAHDLANMCDPIKPEEARLGDAFFYKYSSNTRIHHVTAAIGGGLCLHASGTSKTFGDDPNRVVSLRHYTKCGPFLVAGRLKKEFRND